MESLQGDPERRNSRFGAIRTDALDTDDWSVIFDVSNRGKKGIALDLASDEGSAIMRRLVATADIFVTNLRRPTVTKLGLGFEALSAINDVLVHVHTTGFGPVGPMADDGAYDQLGQALSGMMFLTAGDEPAPLSVLVLDQLAAIATSHAAVTALLARHLHGVGQDVHVSLYGAATWLLHGNIHLTGLLGNIDVGWRRRANSPVRTTYRCADGEWLVCTSHPEEVYIPVLCAALSIDNLMADARFNDAQRRRKNAEAMYDLLDPVFATRTRAQWLAHFRGTGLLFAPVRRFADVLTDEQALVNGYVAPYRNHPKLGDMVTLGYPMSFGVHRDVGMQGPAPHHGEHTDALLAASAMTSRRSLRCTNAASCADPETAHQPRASRRWRSSNGVSPGRPHRTAPRRP